MTHSTLQKWRCSALIVFPVLFSACSHLPADLHKTEHQPTLQMTAQTEQAAQNKKIVIDFYEGVFLKHQVAKYADQYIGQQYIQHNPDVPNGKSPFVNYFSKYFKENPEAKSVIKRAVAQDDLVFLHVHSTENNQDRGVAVVDIFRVEQGKIVEHWDVIQAVPEKSANTNTMF